jgi:hypothetical protein
MASSALFFGRPAYLQACRRGGIPSGALADGAIRTDR